MISVGIFMNGNFICGRSATRVKGNPHEECTYRVDDGNVIKHNYDDGCVELAIKLLRTDY